MWGAPVFLAKKGNPAWRQQNETPDTYMYSCILLGREELRVGFLAHSWSFGHEPSHVDVHGVDEVDARVHRPRRGIIKLNANVNAATSDTAVVSHVAAAHNCPAIARRRLVAGIVLPDGGIVGTGSFVLSSCVPYQSLIPAR